MELAVPFPFCLPGHPGIGSSPDGHNQQEAEIQQKQQTVDDKEKHIYGALFEKRVNILGRPGPVFEEIGDSGLEIGVRNLLLIFGVARGDEQQHGNDDHSGNDLPWLKPAAQKPCPICHVKQNKAVNKAETVGDLVGKMEAVPDIIQMLDDEAQVQKQEHHNRTDAVTPSDLLAGEE